MSAASGSSMRGFISQRLAYIAERYSKDSIGVRSLANRYFSDSREVGKSGIEDSNVKTGGLPEVTREIEQECNTDVPEEELRARKSASIMNWLESRYGRERVALAKILQEHQVVVRGSREDGLKLLEALLEWKQQEL